MFESLFKSMPSILDSLKEKNVESEYSVDVTTDEGIKKVRDSVNNLKENISSLKEYFADSSWLSFIYDKSELDNIEASLDEILEDAEKKYAEAHKKLQKEETEETEETEEKPKSANNYVRPVLLLKNEEASEAYTVVDKYLETQICPRLPKDTTPEYIQSIKESLADFTAWILLNKY